MMLGRWSGRSLLLVALLLAVAACGGSGDPPRAPTGPLPEEAVSPPDGLSSTTATPTEGAPETPTAVVAGKIVADEPDSSLASTGAWEYDEGKNNDGLRYQTYTLEATDVSGEVSDFGFLTGRCTQGSSLEVVISTSHYIPGDSEQLVSVAYRFASERDLITENWWSNEVLRSTIYPITPAFEVALRTASGPLSVAVVDSLGSTQYYTFWVDGAVVVFNELDEGSLCLR